MYVFIMNVRYVDMVSVAIDLSPLPGCEPGWGLCIQNMRHRLTYILYMNYFLIIARLLVTATIIN